MDDAELDATTEKLSQTYEGEGVATNEEIREVVKRAAEGLRDVRVKTFVPLLAENKARDVLEERRHHDD